MKYLITAILAALLCASTAVFAVAGAGTGTQVAGAGSGTEVAGAGSGTQVAGAGSGTQVAGAGSGTEVAGAGSGTEVAGAGSGTQVAGAGTGTQVAGAGTGTQVAGTGSGTQVAGTGSGTQVAGAGTGTQVAGTGSGAEVAGTGSGAEVAGTGSGAEVAGTGSGAEAVDSLDACYSGSYYDPDSNGTGINVEVLEDQVIAYFYRPGGDWFLMQGNETDGFEAYQPWDGGVEHVGWGYLSFVDENTVEFGYFLRLDIELVAYGAATPWCLHEGCAGDFVYTRLTQPIPCE